MRLFFRYKFLFFLIIAGLFFTAGCRSSKQSAAALSPEEVGYRNAITNRSAKIVETLGINDSSEFYKVRDLIALQYRNLRDIDASKDKQVKLLQEKYANNKAEADAQIKNAERAAEVKTATLHKSYLQQLEKYLNAGQIDKVKDGMTYGVLPITYKAYLDMIPSLKEDEQKYIYDALLEAREKAMDGGSSDEKHGIFGKYKGRINNYLSARGYNLTKEREEWSKRIDAAKKKN